MLIKQKSSWFWGMLEYLDYQKYVPKKVGEIDKIRVRLTTTKSLLRDAVSWLCSSIGILILILGTVLGFLTFNYIMASISLFALFVYAILPSFFLLQNLGKIFQLSVNREVKIKLVDKIIVPIFSVGYLIISSIGPWITFKNKIDNILWGKEKVKHKTER